MAWERAEEFFPTGKVPLSDGSIITIDELKKSKVQTIYMDFTSRLKNMTKELRTYVWGANGECAILQKYNVNNLLPHPSDSVHPLNTYGIHMINNYTKLNNIDLTKMPIIEEILCGN